MLDVTTSPKSGVTTLLLCLFLGVTGAHRFYVGRYKTAILMFLTLGGLGFWTLIDLVLIANSEFKDAAGHNVLFTRNGESPWKTLLGIFAMMIAAGLFYGMLIVGGVIVATNNITDVVLSQLDAMQKGDYELAYSYTSPAFQEVTSLGVFEEFVKEVPAMRDNVNASFPTRQIHNSQGLLKGTITAKDGSVTPVKYLLVYENGQWKILGIQIGRPSAGIQDEGDSEAVHNTDRQTSRDESAKKLTYADKHGKYSVTYPGNWYYEKPDDHTAMFSGKRGTPSYYSTITIQWLPMKKAGGVYGDAKEIVADLKGQIQNNTAKVKYLMEGDAELPKNDKFHGQYFEVTYIYKGESMKKMQYVLISPDGNTGYSFGYTTRAGLYDANLPVAKAMYESWDIK